MSDDLFQRRKRVQLAENLGEAGVIVSTVSLAFPLAAPDLDARWEIAFGLLTVGGIFIGVSYWLLRRLR
jgi:hypothetical protein